MPRIEPIDLINAGLIDGWPDRAQVQKHYRAFNVAITAARDRSHAITVELKQLAIRNRTGKWKAVALLSLLRRLAPSNSDTNSIHHYPNAAVKMLNEDVRQYYWGKLVAYGPRFDFPRFDIDQLQDDTVSNAEDSGTEHYRDARAHQDDSSSDDSSGRDSSDEGSSGEEEDAKSSVDIARHREETPELELKMEHVAQHDSDNLNTADFTAINGRKRVTFDLLQQSPQNPSPGAYGRDSNSDIPENETKLDIPMRTRSIGEGPPKEELDTGTGQGDHTPTSSPEAEEPSTPIDTPMTGTPDEQQLSNPDSSPASTAGYPSIFPEIETFINHINACHDVDLPALYKAIYQMVLPTIACRRQQVIEELEEDIMGRLPGVLLGLETECVGTIMLSSQPGNNTAILSQQNRLLHQQRQMTRQLLKLKQGLLEQIRSLPKIPVPRSYLKFVNEWKMPEERNREL